MDRFREPLALEKALDLKIGGERDLVLAMVEGARDIVRGCCWRSSSESSSTIVDVLGTIVLAINVFFSGVGPPPLVNLLTSPSSYSGKSSSTMVDLLGIIVFAIPLLCTGSVSSGSSGIGVEARLFDDVDEGKRSRDPEEGKELFWGV